MDADEELARIRGRRVYDPERAARARGRRSGTRIALGIRVEHGSHLRDSGNGLTSGPLGRYTDGSPGVREDDYPNLVAGERLHRSDLTLVQRVRLRGAR